MLKGLAICLELHYVTFVLTDAIDPASMHLNQAA